MADDVDTTDVLIRLSNWEGSLPVVFQMHASDIATLDQPEPYYALLSRGSYLPLVSEAICEHFGKYAPEVRDEVWYDVNGVPLKWHYPVGVLFDTWGSSDELPWEVTVHFQEFPATKLLRCPSLDTVKQHYMNVLKEANYLKHGEGTKVNRLPKTDQNNLWEGIVKNEFDTFWDANELLRAELDSMKYVPVRVVQPNSVTIQQPITPKKRDGTPKLFADLLHELLPEKFGVDGEPFSPEDESSVCVQGVRVPNDTPLVWLSQYLSHPDNFVYIVVR